MKTNGPVLCVEGCRSQPVQARKKASMAEKRKQQWKRTVGGRNRRGRWGGRPGGPVPGGPGKIFPGLIHTDDPPPPAHKTTLKGGGHWGGD